MIRQNQKLFPIILLVTSYAQIVGAAVEVGCVGTVVSTGFDANFYSYPLDTDVGFTREYFISGYRTESHHVGLAREVKDINFRGRVPSELVPSVHMGAIYGVRVSVSNFSLELTGWFLPPLTGQYSFSMLYPEDAMSLQVGGKESCCGDFSRDVITDEIKFAGNEMGGSVNVLSVFLEKDVYYPIRVFYINSAGDYALTLKVLLPNWTSQDVFRNVFQLSVPECEPVTTFSAHTSAVTITQHSSKISNSGFPTSTSYDPSKVISNSGSHQSKILSVSGAYSSRVASSEARSGKWSTAAKSSKNDRVVSSLDFSSDKIGLSSSFVVSSTRWRVSESDFNSWRASSTRPDVSTSPSSSRISIVSSVDSAVASSLVSRASTVPISTCTSKGNLVTRSYSLNIGSTRATAPQSTDSSRVGSSKWDLSASLAASSNAFSGLTSHFMTESEIIHASSRSLLLPSSSVGSSISQSQSKSEQSGELTSSVANPESRSTSAFSRVKSGSKLSSVASSKAFIGVSSLIKTQSRNTYSSSVPPPRSSTGSSGISQSRMEPQGSTKLTLSTNSDSLFSSSRLTWNNASAKGTRFSETAIGSPDTKSIYVTSGFPPVYDSRTRPSPTFSKSESSQSDLLLTSSSSIKATQTGCTGKSFSSSEANSDIFTSRAHTPPANSASRGRLSSTDESVRTSATNTTDLNDTRKSCSQRKCVISTEIRSHSACASATGSFNSMDKSKVLGFSTMSYQALESYDTSSALDGGESVAMTAESSSSTAGSEPCWNCCTNSHCLEKSISGTKQSITDNTDANIPLITGDVTSSRYYVQPTESHAILADVTVPPGPTSVKSTKEPWHTPTSKAHFSNNGIVNARWTSLINRFTLALALLAAT